jgi:hypothetical protein
METKDPKTDFVDAISPFVEQANQQNDSHGHVDNGMIIIAKPEKTLRKAGKRTVVRFLTEKVYKEKI